MHAVNVGPLIAEQSRKGSNTSSNFSGHSDDMQTEVGGRSSFAPHWLLVLHIILGGGTAK